MKKTGNRKIWLTAAVVHWLISLLTDKMVFTCESPAVYGIWKAVFFVFILGFYQIIGYVIHEYRTGNNKIRHQVRFFAVYFLIMMVFLLLTWPGIWRIDEFSILRTAGELKLHYWQGYLTSVYYIICLMMLPFPVSVVFFMCLINSAITGYLVYKIWEFVGERKYAYLLYIPFLFFPVIDSNLYPMRMSIYAFLELLLLAKVCFWAYEKRMPGKNEFIWTALLAGIVTAWRSESIYYLLLFPVLLAAVLWKRASKRQTGTAILIYLAFSVFLVGFQKIGEGSGNGYEITSIICPLTPLVVEAAYQGETDLIAEVDRVINCADIFEGASEGQNGIEIFWRWSGNGLTKDNYTEEDFRAMKRAYYQLILRHPGVFLRERLSTYRQSTTLMGNITEADPPSPVLNNELRNKTYALLELRSFEDYFSQGAAAKIVYSTLLPSLILAVGAVWFLLKREWVYLGSCMMAALKVPLVFLTAPSTLFMYYYSPYLCGWVLLFSLGILWYGKRKAER